MGLEPETATFQVCVAESTDRALKLLLLLSARKKMEETPSQRRRGWLKQHTVRAL